MVIPGLNDTISYIGSENRKSKDNIKMDYYEGESCMLITYDNFETGAKIFGQKQIMTLNACDLVD